MGDIQRRPQSLADRLLTALEELAVPLSKVVEQQALNTPPEQADLSTALMRLHHWIPGFVAKTFTGDVRKAEWENLANVLQALEAACRRQHHKNVVVDQPNDIGEA